MLIQEGKDEYQCAVAEQLEGRQSAGFIGGPAGGCGCPSCPVSHHHGRVIASFSENMEKKRPLDREG